MIKISTNFTERTIEEIVERMPMKFKLKLVRKLQKQAHEKRWKTELDKVIAKMRHRIEQKGISDKEIDRLCEEVRKEHHAKTRRRA